MTNSRPVHIHRADYPALTAFLQGYLHEDFATEYGSVPGAAYAFWSDAPVDDRLALARDLRAFAAATADLTIETIGELLTRDLGGAWSPSSRDELDIVANTIGA